MKGVVDLIHQGDIWVDGNGAVHRIAEMDIRHAGNVLRFLTEGSRPQKIIGSILREFLSGPMPNGEMAQDALDSETERLMEASQDETSARIWITGQPLVEALARRAQERYGKPVARPRQREVFFVVKVTVPADRDVNMVEYEIEEALKRLEVEAEITNSKS